MYVPPAFERRAEIDAAIHRIQEMAGPDVVRIGYDIERDWDGDWAVFFRILLTDDAARNRLRELSRDIRSQINRQLDLSSLGIWPYVDFRSESEQARLREPAWA